MSAKHHKYYPIEVLEKELILLGKIEHSWGSQAKIDHAEKYNKLKRNIRHLKESIGLLDEIDKTVPEQQTA